MIKLNKGMAESHIATINAARGLVDHMPILQQYEAILDDYEKRSNTDNSIYYEAAYTILYELAKNKYESITGKKYVRVINVSELDAQERRIG